MRVEQLEPDIFVFIGETHQSVSTAVINGDDVLLIDGLAGEEDAEELRRVVEVELHKQVRFIVSTHYMTDHMAAFRLFPRAAIIAHQDYTQTFDVQKSLTDEERLFFVSPTIEISDKLAMKWGRCSLDIFHNPSKAVSMLSVDIPEADLLAVGDAFFGSTVFLSSAGVPELFVTALRRLQGRGRNRVIPGHIGTYGPQAFENALFYLKSLQARVEEARESTGGEDSILEIPIESCLAPRIEGSDFEKEYHQINLSLIIERELFIPLVRPA